MLGTHAQHAPSIDSKDDAPKPGHFRTDIEGLRAVAVVLVVLDHLASWPSGGFVGVDVFFVISGFLITGLLLNESRRTGRISIRNFYVRRARRILPVALTVLLATVVAANLVFRGSRVKDTVTDVWWALGFSANMHFASVGTDYFQANRPPSLVQHFWSLAVEEQFYLIWPIVMLIILTLIGKRLSVASGQAVLLAVVGAGTVASFIWAVQETIHSPAAAYFSTPVRGWELGAGAVVAVLAARFPGIPGSLGRARGPLSACGLAGIVASAVIVKADSGFPAPSAALPILATTLIIIAGMGAPLGLWTAPLTNRVTAYTGRVSFSLYLWHWPVIVIAGTLVQKSATVYYPMVLTAVAALTVFSYHFIEAPLRTAQLTTELSHRQPEGRQRLGFRLKPSGVHLYAASVTLVLAVAVVSLYLIQPAPPGSAAIAGGTESRPTVTTHSDPNVAQPPLALTHAITAATAASIWPKLNPSLDQLDTNAAFAQWKGCRGTTDATLSGCTFGDTGDNAKVAVVLGDSFAMAWLPTIRAALVPQHWVVYGLLKEQCPAAFVSVLDGQHRPQFKSECDSHHAWMISKTAQLHPRLVILASRINFDRLASKATDSAAEAEYRAGITKTIGAIRRAGNPRILTLSPPPVSPPLESCATAVAQPSGCLGRVSDGWRRLRTLDAVAAAATGSSYADTHLWFCTADGVCPSFVRSTPVKWDGAHLTDAYARSLGSEMAGLIAKVMK